MAITFITPVDITPTVAGSYQEVDVSSHVSAGATGVILRVVNTTANDKSWSVRKNGSTDDFYNDLDALAQTWDFIGVDSNKIFEAKIETTGITIEITGYFESEATFFTNATDVTPGTLGSYQDVDISSLTGSNIAIAAIGVLVSDFTLPFYARKNGSSDEFEVAPDNRQPFICGVDSSEIFECIVSGESQQVKLIGYLTSGVTFDTNATDATPTTDDTWENHSLPAGSSGGFFWAHGDNAEYGARKDTTSLSWNERTNQFAGFAAVEADSQTVETYSGSVSTLKIHRIGYTLSETSLTVQSASQSFTSDAATFSESGIDVLSPDGSDHTQTAAATTVQITGLGEPIPNVICMIGRPYDDSLEREVTGGPAAFGAAPFGNGVRTFTVTGGETAVYLSDIGYISRPSDTPANQLFRPRLVSVFNFEVRMFSGFEPEGRNEPGIGDITFLNGDGEYDDEIMLGWDGRPVELWRGQKTGSFDNFTLLFRGTARGIEWDERSVSILLRDRQTIFEKPIQHSFYDGSGGLNGNADLKGRAKPQVFGEKFNLEAVLVDPTNLVYQIHDGEVNDIPAVRDAGTDLTKDIDVTQASILTQAVSAGTYVTVFESGLFKLGASPSGRVTADVQGDVVASTYVNTVSDIAKRIVTTRVLGDNLPDDQLDTDALSTVDTDQPASVGVHVGTDLRNISDVLDELLAGVGGFWGFTREGLFTLGILKAPDAGDSAVTYDDKRVSDSVPPTRLNYIPSWRRQIAYKKLGVAQTVDELAAGVSDSNKSFYSKELRFAAASDLTIRRKHKLARDTEVPANFANEDDADTESERTLTLYGADRDIYRVGITDANFTRWLGDTVTLDLDRFDLSGGKPFIVIGVEESAEQGRTVLELWG